MAQAKQTAEIKFPAKLNGLFKKNRYKIYYGGRGAAKSWGIARALLVLAAQNPTRILCTREIQKSIQDSVHRLLADQIIELGLQDFFEVQATRIIGRNGSEFLFAGLRHNISNLKSFEGVDIVWVEEAQSVSKASWDVLIPTIRKDGSEIWVSFNPDLEDDETYQRFVLNTPTGALVEKVNWQDNPWFPAVLKQEMEDCRNRSENDYMHIWEGRCKQAVEGAIFADDLAKAAEDQRITRVGLVAGQPVHTFWDLGQSDNTAIWFAQVVGLEYRLIDYYQSNGQKMAHYIDVLAKRAYPYGDHYLPHDATHEQLAANSTIKQQLHAALQANPALGKVVHVVPRIAKKALAVDAARSIFAQCLFDRERTADGLQCLRHSRYDRDPETGRISKEPVHDIWSHGTDAFMCMAQHFKKPALVRAPVRKTHRPAAVSWMGA